ncbi:MAG: hypothetical protein EZS28_014795 [Streblomastix strix]|uniref:Uncharacterized protein n=1 Tax=Streblomastix strix TaxID=222440 RepID=A0A5J4W5H1_9EUKA|nr:MAG: hypothetical protein EZS28_014795 [Streblomastix strix]
MLIVPKIYYIPSVGNGKHNAGIQTDYARQDHQHPHKITSTFLPSDSASGSVGSTNQFARNDHSHPLNISISIPPQDSDSGSVETTNCYARNDHSHPINVQTNASIVSIVNGVGTNGTSAFYARHDHIHPQQLTQDGNVTATKIIKTGRLTTEVLCANGGTLNGVVDIESNQTIIGIKTFNKIFQIIPTGANYNEGIRIAKTTNESCQIFFEADPDQHSGVIECQQTVGIILNEESTAQQFSICQSSDFSSASRGLRISTDGNTLTFNGNGLVDTGTDQTIAGIKTFARVIQTQPNGNSYNKGVRMSRSTNSYYSGVYLATGIDDGLRISRADPTSTSNSSIQLGYSRTSNTGAIEGQRFVIAVASQAGDNTRGIQISADGNILTFNGSVIAGTGASNGASNGSVNYSAGNPILWVVNSTGTEGEFYSNGSNIYWRARTITLGSVPP